MAWELINMEKEPFGKFEIEKIQCLRHINETLREILKELQKINVIFQSLNECND